MRVCGWSNSGSTNNNVNSMLLIQIEEIDREIERDGLYLFLHLLLFIIYRE